MTLDEVFEFFSYLFAFACIVFAFVVIMMVL